MFSFSTPIPVLFHKASPSEIVSPIDIDFLNLLDEPPFEVLELESPIISQEPILENANVHLFEKKCI